MINDNKNVTNRIRTGLVRTYQINTQTIVDRKEERLKTCGVSLISIHNYISIDNKYAVYYDDH